jgi:HK97 family phage portal protein
MRLPKFLRRTPTYEDVAQHMRKMAPEKLEYMASLTKSNTFGTNFLSAVQSSSSTSDTPSFLNLSYDKQLKVIQNAAVVHACVTTVASAFQEAPITVEQRESDGSWKKVPEEIHPLVRPFKNNPDLSESEIMMYSVMNLELTGKSFLWLLRDSRGEVVEVWPVPVSWVTIVLKSDVTTGQSGSRLIDSYKVQFNNTPTQQGTEGSTSVRTFSVPAEDMIYTKFPAPWNLIDGLSPLGACYSYVDLENKSVDYTSNSLENLNLPGLVIKTDRQMTDDQKKMLRATLAEKIGPAAARAALSFSGKDMTVDMVNPLESYGWDDFHKLNETRICMSFKVPPIVIGALVGLEETTGWASGDMREAKKWLYRNTVHGIWKMYSSDIARAFIPEENREKYRIAFDDSQVPELQEERGKLEERALALFNASMVTLNEAREMMLMKSIDQGDLFKTNLSNMFLPADQLEAISMQEHQEAPNAGTEDEDEFLGIEPDEADNEGT